MSVKIAKWSSAQLSFARPRSNTSISLLASSINWRSAISVPALCRADSVGQIAKIES